MRKINLMLIGALAVLAFVCTLGAGPVEDKDKTKTLTFAMPPCPIKAHTVLTTTAEFMLPKRNPLGQAFTVVGTVQVADQSGAVILKTSDALAADLTSVFFARTVNTIAHQTASLAFDRGCTSGDPYGSNNCSWKWGDSLSARYQGVLQEDISSGKLVVDLKIDNTIPLAFTCPVCGANCTITIPDHLPGPPGRWDEVWDLWNWLFRFPFLLIAPLPNF